MNVPTSLWRMAAAVLFAIAFPVLSAQATERIDEPDDLAESARVARVSHVEGNASLRQAGATDWQDLGRNMPVFDGDEIYTGDDSRLEVQIGGGRYLRIAERTSVIIDVVDADSIRFEVAAGRVELTLRDLDRGESYEINAPSAATVVREEGVYHVDVDDNGDTIVAVERGRADVLGVERSFNIERGEVARFDYDDPYAAALGGSFPRDDFDAWTDARDDYYDQAYASASQVNSIIYRNDIYGLADLSYYGSWFNYGRYGYCWRPTVASGWVPYGNGTWLWFSGHGWTWISGDPWGWAPYHHGRWCYDASYGWLWVPWSQYSGGYGWQPGHVYWYPYGNGYAWVPLAPNEPLYTYRRLASRHRWNDGYRPVNLRHGGGFASNSDDGRLRPVRGPVDRGKLEGVRGAYPLKPRTVALDKPKFDVRPAAPLREKPVVVVNPVVANKPRGAATGRGAVATRPVRVAVKPGTTVGREPVVTWTGPGRSAEAPGRDKGGKRVSTGAPSMTDLRPTTSPEAPVRDAGEVRPIEKPRRVDEPAHVEEPRVERPKPRREHPVGPSSDEVREKSRRERPTDVDRAAPVRPVAPRTEARPERPRRDDDRPERSRRDEPRPAPVQPSHSPRVERANPPQQRAEPAPRQESAPRHSGGGGGGGGGGGKSRNPKDN